MIIIQGKITDAVNGSPAAGYSIVVSGSTVLKTNDIGKLTLPFSVSGRSDNTGVFRIEFENNGEILDGSLIITSSPNGTEVDRRTATAAELEKPIEIPIEKLPSFIVQPSDEPTLGQRIRIQGRIIDEKGVAIPSGLPVVIYGATDGAEQRPQQLAETGTGGYFSCDWIPTVFDSASAKVSGSDALPIPLDNANRLPLTILLVLKLEDIIAPGEHVDNCGCHDTPPSVPDSVDLVANSGSFSQDLGGGCLNLSTPNRALEEFTYSFVVRTSEPNVKGVTLGTRRFVPSDLIADLLGVSVASAALKAKKMPAMQLNYAKMELDVESARNLVRSDDPPSLAAFERAAWLSEVNSTKSLIDTAMADSSARVLPDADHLFDYDFTPTIHLSIEIAYGHILQYKEVWRADGYSLGDLLYSLPLAPSQRRQIAVVSWERKNRASRTEQLEAEEQLDALLSRDRDIREIVGSSLHEETSAGSSNTTWGAAGGIGAGFIGSGFGIFGGVAGGGSGSTTKAWQNSSRQFSANSLQSLRDRVGQRASSVRSQRSTVVEALTQQESQRIETETVANYNRCHAITIEYFEVLRHFLVTHELASVQECLFIPLPMPVFDRAKALRWREPLTRYLKDRSLSGGFASIERISDNWVGWDYPLSRYCEEAPETLDGELRISFVLPRPRDDEDGKYLVDEWRPFGPFLPQATQEIFIAKLSGKEIKERDRIFRVEVAPLIAKSFVQQLRFAYVTINGSEREVSMDATLVSNYAEGIPLYVSLNPLGGLPDLPREDIQYFKVWSEDAGLPLDAKIIVHSGKLRYQTPHFTSFLFNDQRILDDIRSGDAVLVPTPVTRSEMRNPRDEDRFKAEKLVTHLNAYLEYYHQAIWMTMDAQRRFMLLDTILLSETDQRSVASVCVNEIIGIAGNSIILPAAPGQKLNPQIETVDEQGVPVPLINAYAVSATPGLRVSVPTNGVYAEAIMGHCNSCEQMDDTRYWRWSTEGQLDIPEISTVATDSRSEETEPALTPSALPAPLVSIQNAPVAPAPVGLGAAFDLLAKPELFRDITGLEGTQKNAGAAFDAAISAASGLGDEAFKLARQQELGQNAQKMLDRISQAKQDGLLSDETAQELSLSALQGLIGDKPEEETKSPTQDKTVKEVLDKSAQAKKADIKVTSGDETVEVSFEDEEAVVGSGSGFDVGEMDVTPFTNPALAYTSVPVLFDIPKDTNGDRVFDEMDTYVFDTIDQLELTSRDINGSGSTLDEIEQFRDYLSKLKAAKHIKDDPTGTGKYFLERCLLIKFPAEPSNKNAVAGNGKLPLVVLVHGNHQSWEKDTNKPNYKGYTYLQDELAKAGIISVSVDTNAANYFGSLVSMRSRFILDVLDTFNRMNGDKSSRFFGRIDTTKIGMMGHSRGGDAIIDAAVRNSNRTLDPKYGIKYLCALAPTDFTGQLASANRLVVTPAVAEFLTVVYGSLDGDVAGYGGAKSFVGTGFRHYDRATCKKKSMVFIEHCIHNRFNTTWAADGDESGLLPIDLAKVPTLSTHQSLANEYIGEFFKELLGQHSYRDFFTGKRTNSSGTRVALQWSFGSTVNQVDGFELVTRPGRTIASSAHISAMDAVPLNSAGTVTTANATNHQTNILYTEAAVATDETVLKLDVSGTLADWKAMDALNFRVAVNADLSDETTVRSTPQPSFSLEIIYDDDTSEQIVTAALTGSFTPMEPFFHRAMIGLYEITSVTSGTGTLEMTVKGEAVLIEEGQVILMTQPPTTPVANGEHVATRTSQTTFTIPFTATVPAGAKGKYRPIENCTVLRLDTVHVPLTHFPGTITKPVKSVSVIISAGYSAIQFFDSFEIIKL